MPFKTIVVISKAGKAGKSTVAKQLIAPMIQAQWIEIETFNEKGTGSAMTVSGRKLNSIAEAIAISESNVVLDVGISNYDLFMKELAQLSDTAAAIDFWVIPVQPEPAFVNEGISTAKELVERLGIEPGRIMFVPNSVEQPEDMLDDFRIAIAACKATGMHFVEAPIVQNVVFASMSKRKKSIIEFADEAVDWDSKIAAESDTTARAMLASEKVLHERVKFLAKNLRGVWAASPMRALAVKA
jgi:hypothetical protein